MKCEIEFFAVGDASCAGDAIILRYGEENSYNLMLVDGGHSQTGTEIVEHLKEHFGDDAWLSHVVLTHSDSDHASGLRTVLAEVPVGALWMHVPWLLADRTLFDDNWTDAELQRAIKDEYDIIAEIVEIAQDAGIPIYYPFTGQTIGPFTVCSPSKAAYQHLLPQFDKTPDPDQDAIEAANMWLGKETLAHRIMEKVRAAVSGWTSETWENERLRDGGVTSASNETSVVLFGEFELGKVLLTGDGGVNALWWAADNLETWGVQLQGFRFVQIPHHGSRRNVGPTILNRLVGPILPEGSSPTFSAFVSAPADDARHPRKMVTNAFIRRGGRVIATQGGNKVHWGGFAARAGYSSVESMPFQDLVEDYDD